jgi:hypothetical protein
VPVHPGAAAAQQDRTAGAVADRAVDGPADCWRQRHEDDLAAFAADAQYPVAVFLADVADVRSGRLEDPQTQEAEHGHQGEVVPVRGFAGGAEQGLELQVGKPQRRGLGRHGRAADVLSW